MITHLLTRIDLMMNSFSKGQKRSALYIEEHYDKAAFMTASKLGETVGVSESTVVRFATELGYDGYPKLQKVGKVKATPHNSRRPACLNLIPSACPKNLGKATALPQFICAT